MQPTHLEPLVPAASPMVTIAIPTFNRASWLRDCVRLALNQSYDRFEVLVSDNASSDETALVLDRLKDDRLRVVRQPENLGAIANWNACVAEAKGEYIVFVPDDDRIDPWLLERCMALVRSDPRLPIIMALGEAFVVDTGRACPPQSSEKLQTGVHDGTDVLDEYLKGRITVQGCTTVLGTERLRASGGFPTGWPFASDLSRHLPLLLEGKAGFVNECCGTYSIHGATETSRLALETHLEDIRKLVDLINETAENKIKDDQKRRHLQLEAKRYLARHAISLMTAHRKWGAQLNELGPLVWKWKRYLSALQAEDALIAMRLFFWLLVPAWLISWLRTVKRQLSRKPVVDPNQHCSAT